MEFSVHFRLICEDEMSVALRLDGVSSRGPDGAGGAADREPAAGVVAEATLLYAEKVPPANARTRNEYAVLGPRL